MRKELEKAEPEQVIHYSLKPYKNCAVEARFLEWLPEVELEEIRRLPIFNEQPIGRGKVADSSYKG